MGRGISAQAYGFARWQEGAMEASGNLEILTKIRGRVDLTRQCKHLRGAAV